MSWRACRPRAACAATRTPSWPSPAARNRRALLQPGDHAIIETPAFPNSVQALRYTGATVHTVPSGPEGIDVDALDELAARVKPKIVCVVASFSNPVARR